MIGKRKLNRLSNQVDSLLESETPEYLNAWLDDYKKRHPIDKSWVRLTKEEVEANRPKDAYDYVL